MSKYWSGFTRYMLRVCILNASIFWVSEVYAVEPKEDVIVSMRKGDKAPFDGQLFDPDTAIRWGMWLRTFRERAEFELERNDAICKTELDYKDEVIRIEGEKYDEITNDLEARLLRSDGARVKAEHERDNPPWYKSGVFGFGVGVLSTVAVVVVSTQVF